jgi:DNA-binding NarL/FixJ family response regulator
MPNRIRILLVDDEPDYIEATRQYLAMQQPPFNVLGAGSLRAAIEAIPSVRPDAILLDLGLPDSHGIGTVRAIVPHAGAAPVVVLSCAVTPEVRTEAIQAGAQDAILKDKITPDGLARVLVTAMDRVRVGLVRADAEIVTRIEWCMAMLRSASERAEDTIRKVDRLLAKGDG